VVVAVRAWVFVVVGPSDGVDGRLRVLLSGLLLPHELVHYAVLWPWRDSLTLTVAPRDGAVPAGTVALGRVSGTLTAGTPTWAIRLAAVGPMLVFPTVAWVLDAAVSLGPDSVPVAVLVVALAVWAVPSGGDVQVFQDAQTVSADRSIEAAGPVTLASEGLSVLLTLVAGWATLAVLFV
jgi:hypothetical protein